MSGPHSAPGGGKSSTCDRASQVVVGVSVAARKVWAGELENSSDLVWVASAAAIDGGRAFCSLPAQALGLPGLVPCVSNAGAGNWIADGRSPSALRANPGWACTIFTQGA